MDPHHRACAPDEQRIDPHAGSYTNARTDGGDCQHAGKAVGVATGVVERVAEKQAKATKGRGAYDCADNRAVLERVPDRPD